MARTQTAPKATKIAKSIHQASGDSTIAALESHTTPQAANAARREGVNTGTATNFSGQYLFDRLIANDDAEMTKMDMVKAMVKALDTESCKKSLSDFVNVAKGHFDNAVKAAKEAGNYDEKSPPPAVAFAAARLKTARNHQTVLRIGYGALKFCADKLPAYGYDEKTTGYQSMRVIGLKALEGVGMKWDGSKAEPKEERDHRAQVKAEGLAMAEAMEQNPRKDKEDRATYFARIDKVVARIIKEKQEEETTKQIAKLVADFRTKAGALLPDVLDALLSNESTEELPQEEPAPAMH
jgi:hypothetical protein